MENPTADWVILNSGNSNLPIILMEIIRFEKSSCSPLYPRSLFMFTAVAHLLALVMVFKSWNWLRAFEIEPGTGYLVFKNLFFLLGFMVASISLLFRARWAPVFGSVVSVLLAAWFWLDRTLLNQSPLPFSQQWFTLILSLLLLAVVLASMWLLSPYMKQLPSAPSQLEDNLETKN